MEELKSLLGVIVSLIPLFGLVKTLIELGALPTSTQRAQYDFVSSLAQRTGDPVVGSYASELAYEALINDPRLSTLQRIALLTLPNRTRSLSKYRKARSLLRVRTAGAVLQWKRRRHMNAPYRHCLTVALWVIYVVLCSCGLFSILRVSPDIFPDAVKSLATAPLPIALLSIFLGSAALYHSMKLSIANQLVTRAEFVGPSIE